MGYCRVSHKCREHRQGWECAEKMGDAPTMGEGLFIIWCVCVWGGERALQNFFGGGAEVNILGSMWGTSKERENIL